MSPSLIIILGEWLHKLRTSCEDVDERLTIDPIDVWREALGNFF
jgi:hypothetical protein